jgi:hypothetical protein
MSTREDHIRYLFDAELQFRLTSAVRIAVTGQRQPLDLPELWTHGKYAIRYEEIALWQDQAEYAAQVIQHSATLTMAVAVKDAIETIATDLPASVRRNGNNIRQAVDAVIRNINPKPWTIPDDQVATAYHVSRLIRNAYAHSPFAPQWMINNTLRDTVFVIPDVIELQTRGLHETDFDWRHYGGLLGLYQLCRFTRFKILNDEFYPRQNIPPQQRVLFQQGDLILEQLDKVPDGAISVAIEPDVDGSIDLGNGHKLKFNQEP